MPAVARFTPTPNPNAVKVVLESPLKPLKPHSQSRHEVPRSYSDPAMAVQDPVAKALLSIPGVVGVLISDDGRWVTLTRSQGEQWASIERAARDVFSGLSG